MMQSILFAALGIMQNWSLANSMLINNLITSSILTWVVMSLVTQLMHFWLQPAHQRVPIKIEIGGAILVIVAFCISNDDGLCQLVLTQQLVRRSHVDETSVMRQVNRTAA